VSAFRNRAITAVRARGLDRGREMVQQCGEGRRGSMAQHGLEPIGARG